MESLFLGKNKITKLQVSPTLTFLAQFYLHVHMLTLVYILGICQGLDKLLKLKLLSIQSNRLAKIEGLETLVHLEELYISHNGIKKMEGLDTLVNLVTLDLSNNFIKRIENVSHLTKLEEFWVRAVHMQQRQKLVQDCVYYYTLNDIYN